MIAFEQPQEPYTEQALRALAERGYPPLVLVAQPVGEAMKVVAHVRCHTGIALHEVDKRLAHEIQQILDEPPRDVAARAIV